MSEQTSNPGAPAPTKRKKYHLAPALAIGAVIAVMALLYFGMRSARVQPELPSRQSLGLTLPLPEGWKLAGQRSPAGASGRVAMGSPGATSQAMFITRYRLTGEVSDPRQAARQAESSLRASGAPGEVKLKETKVAGNRALEGAFSAGALRIQITLLFSGRVSWQLSCQSLPGAKGSSTRERCGQVLDGLKVD